MASAPTVFSVFYLFIPFSPVFFGFFGFDPSRVWQHIRSRGVDRGYSFVPGRGAIAYGDQGSALPIVTMRKAICCMGGRLRAHYPVSSASFLFRVSTSSFRAFSSSFVFIVKISLQNLILFLNTQKTLFCYSLTVRFLAIHPFIRRTAGNGYCFYDKKCVPLSFFFGLLTITQLYYTPQL